VAKSVLVYTNHFYPENFKINEIVEALDQKGYKVTVITCVPNYPAGKIYPGYGFFKRNKEQKGNITIRRLPMMPRGSGSKWRMVLNYVSYFFSVFFYTLYLAIFRKSFDCVFVHHTSPLFIAVSPILYKKLKRKTKLILWDLDIWPDTLMALDVVKNERALGVIRRVVTRIHKNYDQILVTSQSFVSIIRSRVPNIPVDYFPNWAEDVFTKRLLEIPDKELDFNMNGLKIMFAGNIGVSQDIHRLFKAIILLKEEKVNWLFVGDGRMRQVLQELVLENDLQNKVHFYGNYPIKFMPYFFDKADVMLLSLKDKEVFSNTVPAKLQSYMAYEKPVLAMLNGEGAQIIKDSDCGWVTNSGNAEKLIEFVRELIQIDSSELVRKGKNGKDYFETYFSKNLRFNQLFNFIEET
jgi:glycosyltransferase involved in cell wall biosynthesis